MSRNRNILRSPQKDRLRTAAIQGSRYYSHYLMNKTFAIVTEDYNVSKISFKKEDYCHFTGLTINRIRESNFFDICYKGTLRNINIADTQHYDYNTLRTKSNALLKLNKFLHADASTNLFLSELTTNTFCFPCAIRNDKENMTICFINNDNHARSLRKARNSKNTSEEKKIIGIFEIENNKWIKCIYIKNKTAIIDNVDNTLFSESLKKYLHIN